MREIEARFARFQEVLGGCAKFAAGRTFRPRRRIEFSVRCDAATQLAGADGAYFASMAGATATAWGAGVEAAPSDARQKFEWGEVFVKSLGIDEDAELAKAVKELADLEKRIAGKEKQLSNQAFLARAPADIVKKEEESLAQLREQKTWIENLQVSLKQTIAARKG